MYFFIHHDVIFHKRHFFPVGMQETLQQRRRFQRTAEKNAWLKGHRDSYTRMMSDAVREARQQEMDVLISKIYEVNKPVVRKIVLRKI